MLPSYTPPRTPEGVPDLQGTWGGPGGAGADDIEDHGYVDETTPPQESFVSDPADGKIPYTPWALARAQRIRAGLARGWPGETGQRLCAIPIPTAPRRLVAQRSIGEDHPAARPRHDGDGEGPPRNPDRWTTAHECRREVLEGNARGRWEGNTLVIDVTGVNGRHWFDSVGSSLTENTRMVEAADAGRTEHHRLRADHRGSDDLHAPVEDELTRCGARGNGRNSTSSPAQCVVAPSGGGGPRSVCARGVGELVCTEGVEPNVVDMHNLEVSK